MGTKAALMNAIRNGSSSVKTCAPSSAVIDPCIAHPAWVPGALIRTFLSQASRFISITRNGSSLTTPTTCLLARIKEPWDICSEDGM
jgi:hypothetical protein